MPLGDVQAFMQYTNQFAQPLSQMANLLNTIQSTIASAERIFDVLDEMEMSDATVDDSLAKPTDAVVSFQHMAFGYDDSELLMKDFNLDVFKGQKLPL